jgi:hypothetical protein
VVPWAHSWSIERAGASSVGRSYEAITELRDAGVLELVYRLTRSKTNCYRLLGS